MIFENKKFQISFPALIRNLFIEWILIKAANKHKNWKVLLHRLMTLMSLKGWDPTCYVVLTIVRSWLCLSMLHHSMDEVFMGNQFLLDRKHNFVLHSSVRLSAHSTSNRAMNLKKPATINFHFRLHFKFTPVSHSTA